MKSRIVSHRLKKVTKKRGKSARVERTMRTQKRASEVRTLRSRYSTHALASPPGRKEWKAYTETPVEDQGRP